MTLRLSLRITTTTMVGISDVWYLSDCLITFSKMVPMAPFSSALHGTLLALTTKRLKPAEGEPLFFSLDKQFSSSPFSNYATMRFEPEALHGANNGLNLARDLLEKIKTKHSWISYGDLWTLAGVCAVQVSKMSTSINIVGQKHFDNDTPYLGDAGSEDPMEAWPH